MDKEAQEKIKIMLEDAAFRSGLSFLVDSSRETIASDIVAKMEELGYRKPPDRPELREKRRADIHAIVSKGCRLCDYWDAENYHCMLNIPIHPAYPCSLADQILALIPDKPPEGEMPILSEEEIREWITKSFGHLNPDVAPFFYMGIEALYVKLGGKKFLTIKQ